MTSPKPRFSKAWATKTLNAELNWLIEFGACEKRLDQKAKIRANVHHLNDALRLLGLPRDRTV